VRSFWVAEVHVSPRIVEKIESVHKLDAEAVVAAVERREVPEASWEEHPHRGWRLLLKVTIQGQRVLVVLYPVTDPAQSDHFHLGTAHKIRG